MASKPVIAVTLASRELPAMVHWRLMFAGLLAHVDGLLISGGADVDPRRYGGVPDDPTLTGVNPVRDANEINAFEVAWSRRLPTLAICRGAQLVNAVRGGTLYADLARDFPSDINHRLGEEALAGNAHQVEIIGGSRLAEWTGVSGAISVNSQHHQGIRALADGFAVTARATDGLIEAYESVTHPLSAVQWHPEISWRTDTLSRRLLSGFVSTCAVPVLAC